MHASFFSRAVMHRAIGSGGAARLVLLPSYLPPRVGRGRGACGVRFRRSEPENQENMEAKIKTEKKEKIRFVLNYFLLLPDVTFVKAAAGLLI